MVVAGLVMLLLSSLFLLLNEVIVKRCRDLATAIFLGLYTLLFVLVPLVLHVFFDGARSIVDGNEGFFQDEFVYHVLNLYGFVLLGSIAFFSYMDRGFTKTSFENDREKSILVCPLSCALLVGFLIFLYSTGMSIEELLVASRFSWFQNSSAWTPGVAISHYFFSLTPVLVFCFILTRKSWINVLFFLFALSVVVLYGILSQDRKWVFYVFSGVLAALYDSGGRCLEIKIKHLIFSTALFLLLIVSQFMRDYFARYMVGQVGESNSFWQELDAWWGFLIEKGDLSYFYRASLEAIDYTLMHGVLEPGGILRRNLLFFLPGSVSGGLKPEDLSAVFSDVVGGEDEMRRGNMPPGLFGLLVISFGVPISVLFICIMSWLIKKADNIFRFTTGISRDVLLASYLSLVLLLLRGDDSSAVYFLIFGCSICYSFIYFNKIFIRGMNG